MEESPKNLEAASGPLKRGRRKTRREGQISPFGEVLTNFMARQRPIWTTGRVARELHTRRQTVANWVYHDITPPVESMLEIMAKLGIPLSELVETYQRRGVAVPEMMPGMPIEALTSLGERRVVEAGQPAKPLSETERLRVQEERERLRRREWDNLIAQTRAVMLATGFPEQALDTLLASLAARRDRGEEPMARYIASEHAPIRGSTGAPSAPKTSQPENDGSTNPLHEREDRRENAHTTNH